MYKVVFKGTWCGKFCIPEFIVDEIFPADGDCVWKMFVIENGLGEALTRDKYSASRE
jgi:hypothetical protein